MSSNTTRSFVCFFVLLWLLLPQTGCKPAAQPESGSATRPDMTANEPAPKPEAPRSVPAVLAADVLRDLGPLLVPADNPITDEKIALGKKLYFDKRLSKDGTISCATCHDPAMAWAENHPTSKGINGQIGSVNSPTVINAAYAKAQFWDGRAVSLEEQALGPIENPIEMGHNLDVLVAIFRDKRDGQLAVVGDGPYLPEMKQPCPEARYMGFLSGEELSREYASADVFAFASTVDTFGNVVQEALSSGAPAIVTDKMGPKEQIIHGETGFITTAAADFGDKLDELIANAALRQQMGVNARNYALTRRGEAVFEQLFADYRTAAQEG